MCAATKGGLSLAGVDVTKEAEGFQGQVPARREPSLGGIRTAARLEWRVHRRGPDISDRSFPAFSLLTATGRSGPWHPARRRSIARSSVRGSVNEIDVDIEAARVFAMARARAIRVVTFLGPSRERPEARTS